MLSQLKTLVAACALVFVGTSFADAITGQGTWETTLLGRDIDGHPIDASSANAVFFYDTALNITWLGNWNAGAGSSYDNGVSSTDGRMTWANAVAWANDLTVGSYSDWRLPNADPSCVGNSPPCTNSEIGEVWYTELGNTPGYFANSGPFMNLQSDPVAVGNGDGYWSGTDYAPDTRSAWMFLTPSAYQGYYDKQNPLLFAVAVRDGDVCSAFPGGGATGGCFPGPGPFPVPEPSTYALMLAGLGVLGLVARRRRASISAVTDRRIGAIDVRRNGARNRWLERAFRGGCWRQHYSHIRDDEPGQNRHRQLPDSAELSG
jgi:hypothetical protein